MISCPFGCTTQEEHDAHGEQSTAIEQMIADLAAANARIALLTALLETAREAIAEYRAAIDTPVASPPPFNTDEADDALGFDKANEFRRTHGLVNPRKPFSEGGEARTDFLVTVLIVCLILGISILQITGVVR